MIRITKNITKKLSAMLAVMMLLCLTAGAAAQTTTQNSPRVISCCAEHAQQARERAAQRAQTPAGLNAINLNRAAALANVEVLDLGGGMFLHSSEAADVLEIKVDDAAWLRLTTHETATNEMVRISKEMYRQFNDDFDLVFFVNNTDDQTVVERAGGASYCINTRSHTRGLGPSEDADFDGTLQFGSMGNLQSAIYFVDKGAIYWAGLHEFMHNWAVFLPQILTHNEGNPHWSYSNAGGQLGGFTYVREVAGQRDGSGRQLYQGSLNANFTGGWGPYGNNNAPYSDIELYLMGMKSAQELRDANFTLQVYTNIANASGAYSFADGYFYAGDVQTFTIDDLIAANGERIPNAAQSQKEFKVLTVAVTQESAAVSYIEDIIASAVWMAGPYDAPSHPDGGDYNFRQATQNRGSIIINDARNSLKNKPQFTLENITVSSGTLTPAFHPNHFEYNLTVDPSVESINITGTPAQSGATVTGGGTVQLDNNAINHVALTVGGQFGESNTYRVRVSRGDVSSSHVKIELDEARELVFKIGVVEGKTLNIDWGDGSAPATLTENAGCAYSFGMVRICFTEMRHTYRSAGEYTIRFSGSAGDAFCPLLTFGGINTTTVPVSVTTATEIDVRNALQLESFMTALTPDVSQVDFRNNSMLLELEVRNSPQLHEIDLSANTQLIVLALVDNGLRNLDIRHLSRLQVFEVRGNQLYNLDLSGNQSLRASEDSYLLLAVSQSVFLTLSGNDSTGWSANIDMNSPTFSSTDITYANGRLTSTSEWRMSVEFEAATGGPNGEIISGYIYFNYVEGTSILEIDRDVREVEEAVVVEPIVRGNVVLTTGPNPAERGSGGVGFYLSGEYDKGINPLVNGELRIFDATGNIVRKISVDNSDNNDNVGNVNNVPRIATWDLRDERGRMVSDGTYLVRGTLTVNGNRERVSVLVGVR